MAVSYRVIRGSTGTSTGNRDITYSGWTETPKAAILFVCGATTEDTPAAHAVFSTVFCDGTNTKTAPAIWTEDASSKSDAQRYNSTTTAEGFAPSGPNATIDWIGTVSFISGGIRINFSDAPGSDFLVMVFAIAGDLTCVVGDDDTVINTGSSRNYTHASGVASEVVFVGGGANINSSDANAQWKLGLWANDSSTSRHMFWFEYDNTTTMTTMAEISNDVIWDGIFADYTTTYVEYTCSQHTDGFTLSNNSGVSTHGGIVTWMSLNFSDSGTPAPSVRVASLSTPNATGDQSETGFGFQPGAVLMVMSDLNAFNTHTVDDTSGTCGVGMFTANDEVSMSWNEDDGAADSNTDSARWAEAGKLLHDDGATTALEAVFKSMDSGGFTLTWNTVDTDNAKQWFYIAFESVQGAPLDYLRRYHHMPVPNPLLRM